jgi:hypothetical protein
MGTEKYPRKETHEAALEGLILGWESRRPTTEERPKTPICHTLGFYSDILVGQLKTLLFERDSGTEFLHPRCGVELPGGELWRSEIYRSKAHSASPFGGHLKANTLPKHLIRTLRITERPPNSHLR